MASPTDRGPTSDPCFRPPLRPARHARRSLDTRARRAAICGHLSAQPFGGARQARPATVTAIRPSGLRPESEVPLGPPRSICRSAEGLYDRVSTTCRGIARGSRRAARRREEAVRRRRSGRRRRPRRPRRRVLLDAGAVGFRQDHDPPDDRGLRAADRPAGSCSTARTSVAGRRSSATSTRSSRTTPSFPT